MEGLASRELTPEVAQTQQPAPAPAPMPELLQLGGPTPLREARGVVWNTVLPEQVVSLHSGAVRLWQLSHGGGAAERGAAQRRPVGQLRAHGAVRRERHGPEEQRA